MEIAPSTSSKRFRSEDSSIDCSPSSPSDSLLCCAFCSFTTAQQDDLDFHHHIHHQHVCSQCSSIFPSYFLLDLHMDEVHNSYCPTRSYRCLIELCAKRFPTVDQRWQHVCDEHPTKNRHFNELHLMFSTASNEEKSNKSSAEKKFGCDSEKTFRRQSRAKPRHFVDPHWDGED